MTGEFPRGVFIDDKGDAQLPAERFENYHEVEETCEQMISADRNHRAEERTRVDGLIAGNAPINPLNLKKRGLSWFPNSNFLESAGFLQASQTPLFDLVVETPHCIDVTLDVKSESNDQRQDWENTMQTEFTWLMFIRWRKSFNFHIPMQQLQMLKHGVGTHIWPTKRWTPRTPRAGMVLFPSNAPINFEEDGEFFMLRDFIPANVLHGFIRNEKAAKAIGWFPDVVWKALANSTKANPSRKDREEVQRRFRNGDIGFTQARQAGIWLNSLWVKEIDTRKISQYIVVESGSMPDVGGYLFKRRNLFDEWPITIFNYDIGDGDLNSVRGLGSLTRTFFELSNRLNNIMAAQVLISALPQFKQTGEITDPDKLKLMRMGAMSIWPKGIEAQLIQFPPLNNGPLELQQHLRRTVEENNQPMTGDIPEPKDRETAFSYNLRSHQSARVSNGLQSLYESNLQQFYDRVFRMVLDTPKGEQPYQKMANEFRERCRKKGVPDEALKSSSVAEVKEVTSTGSGSAATRLQALEGLMQFIYPTTTEEKKITIERDLTGALMGGSKVDRYARSISELEIPTSDDSMAAVESSELSMGGDAVVSGSQNDVKHAASHLQKAEQLMQAVEQGQIQPVKALEGLKRLLQHAGEHLQRLQGNRMKKNEFDQLSKMWEEIESFTQQLEEQIASEQEQGQQDDADISRKDRIASADIQRKDTKATADMQLKFRKTAFGERIADAKSAAQLARQRGNGQRPVAKA